MVVRHNLTAMNANRMLGMTQSSQAKSSEKLSSGYRINRAADDAAGLSISEKMRKQIKGLDKASSNAQDGVSAVQTAEGALTEVHSMLQRMNELAVQASNGTNSEEDRAAIQAEIEQLTTEIDRVAETTKFNETYLLKGDAKGSVTSKTVAAHDAGLAGKLTANADGTSVFELEKELQDGDKVTIAGREYIIGEPKTGDNLESLTDATTQSSLTAGQSITINGETTNIVDSVDLTKAQNNTLATWAVSDTFTDSKGKNWTVVADGDVDHAASKIKLSEVADFLDAGSTITKIAGTSVNHKVAVLKDNELSTVTDSNAIDALTDNLQVGDVYSIDDDEETTVTTNAPTSFETVKDEILGLAKDATVKIGDKTYTVGTADSEENDILTQKSIVDLIQEGDDVEIDADGAGAAAATVNKYTVYGIEAVEEGTISIAQAYDKMAAELEKASSIGTDEGKGAKVVNNNDGSFTITQGSVEVKKALNFNLHIGSDADMTNKIAIDIESMGAANLGIKGITVADDTGVNATYAIDAITDALSKVSSQRSSLGAVQNRLEHTIDNLDNVVENTTAAESRIRDTDMAKEMVEFSKTNILAQAGQSILAQANQSTQGILSLLG